MWQQGNNEPHISLYNSCNAWNCPRCTFKNSINNLTCEMCGGYVHSWSCTACTYINLKETNQCEMCGTYLPKSADLDLQTKKKDKTKVLDIESHIISVLATSPHHRDKLLVSGYCRTMENILHSNHNNEIFCSIPNVIISEIVSYHLIKIDDCWKVIGEDCLVSSDNKTITKRRGHWSDTCYGEIIVPSITTNCIYKWDLLLNKMKQKYKTYDYFIGIAAKCSPNYAIWKKGRMNDYSYMYSGEDKTVRSNFRYSMRDYGNYYGDGDVISIKLQFFDGRCNPSLSYSINGEDQGVAFNDIAIGNNIKYRLAVSLCWQNTSVTIKQFQIIDTA